MLSPDEIKKLNQIKSLVEEVLASNKATPPVSAQTPVKPISTPTPPMSTPAGAKPQAAVPPKPSNPVRTTHQPATHTSPVPVVPVVPVVAAPVIAATPIPQSETANNQLASEEVQPSEEGSNSVIEERISSVGMVGVFDGEFVIMPTGKRYQVPPNYASKSKLVVGDKLKLMKEGDFNEFKMMEEVPRVEAVGLLTKKDNQWIVLIGSHGFRVVPAAIRFFGGDLGDQIEVLLPANYQENPPQWAAVKEVKKSAENQARQNLMNQRTDGAPPKLYPGQTAPQQPAPPQTNPVPSTPSPAPVPQTQSPPVNPPPKPVTPVAQQAPVQQGDELKGEINLASSVESSSPNSENTDQSVETEHEESIILDDIPELR